MKTPNFSEHDHRQLRRMREAIRPTDLETLSMGSLASLIQTLDFLVESLDSADNHWFNAFRSKWGVLEEVYAVALDTGTGEAVSSNRHSPSRAISELAEIITQKEAEIPDDCSQ